jgi:hypothetical protein
MENGKWQMVNAQVGEVGRAGELQGVVFYGIG